MNIDVNVSALLCGRQRGLEWHKSGRWQRLRGEFRSQRRDFLLQRVHHKLQLGFVLHHKLQLGFVLLADITINLGRPLDRKGRFGIREKERLRQVVAQRIQ